MRASVLASLIFASACRPEKTATPPTGEAAAPLRGWHYAVAVAPDVRSLAVRMCFEGTPPSAVFPADRDAIEAIETARISGRGTRLEVRKRKIELAGLVAGDCIDYDVDLEALDRGFAFRRVQWSGESVAVRPGAWLLRPDTIPDSPIMDVRFTLPADVELSVSWPSLPGDDRGSREPAFSLDTTVYRWLGYSAFGKLDVDRFAAAGSDIELAVLDAPLRATPAGLRAWVRDAADSVALLYGTFPRDRLQVVVVPLDAGGGTVYFGAAGRGGGSGVIILMDGGAQDPRLPGGWTTTHELLHHGMPFVSDSWMGEGFVSYYTEVVRTRAGHRSEREGWQELWEAFERGRKGGRGLTLQRTSDSMTRNFAFQRVYWGGAAIGFLIDVELRTRTKNRLSLDDAMRELRSCCGDALHQWGAMELLRKLDAWYGEPIFTAIAREQLDNVEFPPVERAMAELGVRVVEGRVVLDDEHPRARLRRTLMAPRK